MQLARIHHVAIICADYAVSKRFYTEVLGLRVIAENHRAARDSYKLERPQRKSCSRRETIQQ